MHEFATFDYLRPVYIIFIISLLMLLVIVIFQKKKMINGLTLAFISLICSVVSAIILWQIGIIADGLNLAGDPVSFLMFFVVLGLSLLNLLIYFIKNKN